MEIPSSNRIMGIQYTYTRCDEQYNILSQLVDKKIEKIQINKVAAVTCLLQINSSLLIHILIPHKYKHIRFIVKAYF